MKYLSGYFLREPLSKTCWNRCYYCGHTLVDLPYRNHSRTGDHILARTHGRINTTYEDIANIRPACKFCNTLRAGLGHCVGILMLSIIEADYRGVPYREMPRLLGMKLSRKQRRYRAKLRTSKIAAED